MGIHYKYSIFFFQNLKKNFLQPILDPPHLFMNQPLIYFIILVCMIWTIEPRL